MDIIRGICGLILVCVFIYFCYWVAKTVSYNLFYEDMVQETIRELVKTEALR